MLSRIGWSPACVWMGSLVWNDVESDTGYHISFELSVSKTVTVLMWAYLGRIMSSVPWLSRILWGLHRDWKVRNCTHWRSWRLLREVPLPRYGYIRHRWNRVLRCMRCTTIHMGRDFTIMVTLADSVRYHLRSNFDQFWLFSKRHIQLTGTETAWPLYGRFVAGFGNLYKAKWRSGSTSRALWGQSNLHIPIVSIRVNIYH